MRDAGLERAIKAADGVASRARASQFGAWASIQSRPMANDADLDARIAMGMLVAFLLISIESYLASYTLGIFRLSFAKFGPTEIRILLGIANTVLFFLPATRISGWSYRLLDIGGAITIVAMTAMAIFAAVSHTLALYRQETL